MDLQHAGGEDQANTKSLFGGKVETPDDLLWKHKDDHIRHCIKNTRRHDKSRIVDTMTLGHDFVPYLLPRRATEILNDSTSNVEHDVDPKSDVACPPESIVNT
jgi:hypothetical protein